MSRRKESLPQTIRVPLKSKFGSTHTISGYDLEGSPDEIIAKMNALKAEYPGKEVHLEWEQERYEESYSLHLYEKRLETPEEVAARLDADKERKRQQEARERAEFERLQGKYGKTAP